MKNIARILFLLLAATKLSAQTCTVADTCPSSPVQMCDLTANDASLWNETYWLDFVTGLHDMPDAPTELSLTATDTCANGSIAIKYILFLDLDGDGTLETAVGSDSLPGYNLVNYSNMLGSGILRSFDERPVTTNEKYGFALETSVNGSTTTARVRWNTESQPGVYVNPELPYGLHKIRWFVTDAQGQESICEYNFEVKDCKSPTVVCNNGLIINIMATGTITLWATDFLQYTEDNHTPTNQLQLAIRKAGAGTGFPQDSAGNPLLSVTFDCDELGDQLIELWARDKTGNANFCQTSILVMDAMDVCASLVADMVACTRLWCNDAVIAGVDYGFGPADSFDPLTGCATFEDALPWGGNYSVAPFKDSDDPNGVNTLDLIHITRHILGLQPLLSPYAMIAADANKSNSITTFDMVEIKKLIQGVYGEFPNNTSWRFVDANFLFPNPNNPFGTGQDSLSYTIQDSVVYFEWFGIKTGDVDCSAYPGLAAPIAVADDRSVTNISLPDATLLPGEMLELPLCFSKAGEWLGLQMGLRFDPNLLEIEVMPGNLPDMDETSFARPQPGLLNVVWFNAMPKTFLSDENLMTLKVKAKAPARLSETVFLAKEKFASEAYTAGEAIQKLQLQFTERSKPVGETAIFPPQPNPTNAETTMPLRLAQAEMVTLELSDLSGKRLWFNQITLDTGTHLLEIPASALPQSGVYVWRVQAGAMTASGKLVRM